jgi:Beta-lactamase enzyme family
MNEVGGPARRPAHRARRAGAIVRVPRGGVLALVLLVAAGGVLAVVTAVGTRAASPPDGGAGKDASPPAAGSTTTVPPRTVTATSQSTTTTARPPATTTTAPPATTTTTTPLATRVPVPPAPPTTVAASGLLASGPIASYLAAQAAAGFDMTATVFDATTAGTSTYRSTLRLTAASSMKLDILEVLLDHAQAAGTPLTGSQLSLATKMIEDSTNTAAQALWDTEGGAGAVSAYDDAAGLSETAPNEPGYWGLSTTGASDLVRLMSDVAYPSSLLSDAAREEALDLLTHVLPTQAWGLSAGVPAGVTVAIKNGWLPVDGRWEVNSTAWVDGDGRDYVVAVMTWGGASEEAGVDAVEGLSSLLWAALGPAT